MMIIKARYLKNNEIIGREYAFCTDILVKPGDTVEIGKAQAVVTKVDVPEQDIIPFRDNLKKITRKVPDPFEFVVEAAKGLNKGESKDFTCPICGGEAHSKRIDFNGHLRAWCDKCGVKVIQ